MTDTLDRAALLPCPFCGSAAHTYSVDLRPVGIRYNAGCDNVHCDCSCDFRAKSEAEAVELWNRRAPTAEREALERLAENLLPKLSRIEQVLNITHHVEGLRDWVEINRALEAVRECSAALARKQGGKDGS